MSITRSECNFYKKNGYLVKDQLISKKDINKLNSLINKIVKKEKNSKKKIKDQGGTHKATTIITLYSIATLQKIKKYFD